MQWVCGNDAYQRSEIMERSTPVRQLIEQVQLDRMVDDVSDRIADQAIDIIWEMYKND